MSANKVQQYVLLPARGMRSQQLFQLGVGRNQKAFAAALSARPQAAGARRAPRAEEMKIVHQINEDGPKLAEMSHEALAALSVSDPGVRAVPVVYYQPARRPLLSIESQYLAKQAGVGVGLKLKIVDTKTNRALAGARVLAFTDFAQRQGASATSRANGQAVLKLGSVSMKLDVLVVYGPSGSWGVYRSNTTIRDGDIISLRPIDLTVPDYLAKLYNAKPATAGTGVTVGIIDTGVDFTHPDLRVTGGKVFVQRESDAGDHGPAQTDGDHGSHVAGIVASRGGGPSGKRGVAPGTTLFSYRVFPNGGGGASNYDIIRAIEQGVTDGCDLLNLSLGGPSPDEAVREAIKEAFDAGTVCIVAAGNDGRQPVSYPAHWPEAIAVSAAGDRTCFPPESTETMDAVAPFAKTDKNVFIAAFSNTGPEIDLTGPGVGIVSTVPGPAYTAMSGTSMACPAVTGIAAALLAEMPAILSLPRNRDRAIAIKGLLARAARPLGITNELEGLGLVL